MKEKYVHIDVLFGQVQPEQVLAGILRSETFDSNTERPAFWKRYGEDPDYQVDSENIGEIGYLHAARALPMNARRTEDELLQRYRDLKNSLLDQHLTGGIFVLLEEYCRDILTFQDFEPLCRQEHILDWRERSLTLGQDLFVCAGLAAQDVEDGCVSNHFSWPAAIRTDNRELRRMLQCGISENHFHLNGSTRMFSLCWSYLMNHPEQARSYFQNQNFKENLMPSTSYGELDNQQPWYRWIYDAAWIRMQLFQRFCMKNAGAGNLRKSFCAFHGRADSIFELSRKIQVLRYDAAKVSFQGKKVILDYAMTESLLQENEETVRVLVAERSFLYHCFQSFFRDTEHVQKQEQDLFYLYLLIQTRFRRELIQSNARIGFRNFSNYEKRKTNLWGDDAAYWEESYRLSAGAVLTSEDEQKRLVQSLEMRIMPRDSAEKLLCEIQNIDRALQQVLAQASETPNRRNKKRRLQELEEHANFFYVLHFAKEPLKPLERGKKWDDRICDARNEETRRNVEVKAKATAQALMNSSYLCSRIRGIDACNHEIGCRPETFATAFRFLRRLGPLSLRSYKENEVRYWPSLRATYHVGEDFLDLTDGLRAIDEAICFLNMERGDRLGHALALGTEPEMYYRVKDGCVYLPAQDLLDDLVWVLFRSLEWNVPLSSDLRTSMEQRAHQLLRRIYGVVDCPHKYELQDYYLSWRLRGDDPSVAKEAYKHPEGFKERMSRKPQAVFSLNDLYERAKLDDCLWDYGSRMNLLPEQEADLETHFRFWAGVQELLYKYHFGTQERLRGQVIERFEVDAEYIRLIRQFQNRMMQKIMKKGIAVECNPSSNKLIGTFDRYEKHPMFRFNHVGLPQSEYSDERIELQASVNTDDQGVFDTSLENEYALLYGCLQLKKDEEGLPIIDSTAILEYLDRVRKIGNRCVFPKAVRCAARKYGRN